MKCAKCRKALDKMHLRNAVKMHVNNKTSGPPPHNQGGEGAVKQIYHLRCFKAQERNRPEVREARGRTGAPTAYAASLSYGNAVDASDETLKRREEAIAKLEEIRAAQVEIQAGSTSDEKVDLTDLVGIEAASKIDHGELSLEDALAQAEQAASNAAALAERQAELAEERSQEDNRSGVDVADKGFHDQRDPDTIDV